MKTDKMKYCMHCGDIIKDQGYSVYKEHYGNSNLIGYTHINCYGDYKVEWHKEYNESCLIAVGVLIAVIMLIVAVIAL